MSTNRVIKFRAWHKNLNKMLEPKDWHHFGPGMVYGELKSEDHFIMQYTGLKDKNGKEIFEGDVIQYNWKRGKTLSGTDVAEVVWKDTMWTLSKNETKFMDYAVLKLSNSLEVIGNTYEHPELLNSDTAAQGSVASEAE